jgi:hypothetical protein
MTSQRLDRVNGRNEQENDHCGRLGRNDRKTGPFIRDATGTISQLQADASKTNKRLSVLPGETT